uniref:Uncharacterized protein n=1 Tax=Globodera rostochiensis TaxID=31243 RepID=A0A914HD66_GLORO
MPHTATSQFGQQLNSPPFISRRLPRSRVLCPPPIRVRPPPPLRFHLKRLVVHFGLLFVLISQATGQFGEIASVISSLVANGAPAGLAGLGTAGSLGSLGASAGSGAAGALSNFGPLYQLAQAALQLTGTGVGIANQASESAWFPVVVENAAKMHRDFQDRLVQGGGGGGLGGAAVAGSAGGTATAGPKDRSGSKSGGGEFGTDYGKEFGSEEKGGSRRPRGPSRRRHLWLPRGAKRPKLPVPGSLLPGESPPGEFNGKETEEIKSGKKLIGIGSVEEVPLSPPSTEPIEHFGKSIASPEASLGQFLPGEVVPTKSRPMTKTAKPSDISTAGIDYDEEKDVAKSRGEMETNQQKKKTKMTEKIETGFSTDNNGAEDEARGGGEEGGTEESRLEPLIPAEPSAQRLQRLNMTHIELSTSKEASEKEFGGTGDGGEMTHMVPELQKLISQLKTGNLSELDLEELQNQLIGNSEPGEPRENTGPATATPSEDKTAPGDGAQKDEAVKSGSKLNARGSKRVRLPNPKREKASNRNLEAFRKGSERTPAGEGQGEGRGGGQSSGEDGLELVDGHRDSILRKIVDFKNPPVILSLERPQRAPDGLTPFHHSNKGAEKRRSNRIDGGEADGRRSEEMIPLHALGVRSERVEEKIGEGGFKSVEWTAPEGPEVVTPIRTKNAGKEGNETGKSTHKGRSSGVRGGSEQNLKRRPPTSTTTTLAKDELTTTTTEPGQIEEKNAEDDHQQLPVVDSMVEKSEVEQQHQQIHLHVAGTSWPSPAPIWPSDPQQSVQNSQFQHSHQQQLQQQQQIPKFDQNGQQFFHQQHSNVNGQNLHNYQSVNGWNQQQQQSENWHRNRHSGAGEQKVVFQQPLKQQIDSVQNLHSVQQYPYQQNQQQYSQQNQQQYSQQNQQQYPQQNQQQYPQQNQQQYPQQNQQQYPQQNQQQYPQQNQLQYPQQQNHPQQQNQLQNQQQYLQQQNQQQYLQQQNHPQYPQQNQLQYPEQQNHPQQQNQLQNLQQQNNQMHYQLQQPNQTHQQPQQQLGQNGQQFPQTVGGDTASHGRRQFGQRQRAVKQPIEQQSRGRHNEQRADGKKVPKGLSSTPPGRVPSPELPAKKSQQLQRQGKTPSRNFPARTLPPPSGLSQQTTTTPSEVQYPFSSGTLLTLAQPAQYQPQTTSIGRK